MAIVDVPGVGLFDRSEGTDGTVRYAVVELFTRQTWAQRIRCAVAAALRRLAAGIDRQPATA